MRGSAGVTRVQRGGSGFKQADRRKRFAGDRQYEYAGVARGASQGLGPLWCRRMCSMFAAQEHALHLSYSP